MKENGDTDHEQVLPDLPESSEILENVRQTLEKYGLECKEVDRDKKLWYRTPKTKDGDENPNCIILKDATKKVIDESFSALNKI